MKALPSILPLLIALVACQKEQPAPNYPSPEDPPIEETELFRFFEPEEDDEEWEDEEWEDEEWEDEAEDGSSSEG